MPTDQEAIERALMAMMNNCAECVIGLVNREDAENCPACCEHNLCVFHEGVERGVDLTIRQAQKAWDIL